jgi:septum formation protein
MKSLILASGSEARRQLLEQTGHPFEVDVSNYEEDMSLNLKAKDLAIFLSKGKADEVAKRHKNAVVLGADSFCSLDGELLGKPHTPERAEEMLSLLSSKKHVFITGFTIIDTDSREFFSDAVETNVYFRNLTPEEINNYLAKEDTLERAGAYIIQGLGGMLIDRIEGDYTNVMGLPLGRVAAALKKFGISLL